MRVHIYTIQLYRKGKRNERDEVVEIIKRRFGQPEEKLTRYDYLARNWAEKLKTLKNDGQRIGSEKLINDVLFEAELGRLTTSSYIERVVSTFLPLLSFRLLLYHHILIPSHRSRQHHRCV